MYGCTLAENIDAYEVIDGPKKWIIRAGTDVRGDEPVGIWTRLVYPYTCFVKTARLGVKYKPVEVAPPPPDDNKPPYVYLTFPDGETRVYDLRVS